MYKISYEKCVCFLFLVIFAILSCSGFRIDNLAMTDISKRNSTTTTQEDSLFINRLISTTTTTISNPVRHRIRHHRQLRNHQLHNLAIVHRSPIIPIKYEQFNQSSTPFLQQNQQLRPVRSQRSSTDGRMKQNRRHHHHHQQQQQQHQCPEDDAAWKAYVANTVVLASVESMSSERQVNYTVVFRVLKRIKNNAFPVDHIKLVFASNDTRSNRQYHHKHHHHHHRQCENKEPTTTNNNDDDDDVDDRDDDDENEENRRPQQRQHSLVKAKIDKSKEYFVFLNAYSAHNYSAVGAPELRRKRVLQIINKVTNSHFKPRQVAVVELDKKQNHENRMNSKRLKLVCRVKGFPIPRIIWKWNNIDIRSNRRIKITYKKRKSTLVIRNLTDSDMGRYECLARGVDGSRASKQILIEKETNLPSEKPDSGTPCDEKMKQDYCLNGGTCRYLDALGEYYCVCATGYTGKQCAEKSSDQSSMYRQTPIYTCKIGLYTKYDNC